MLKDDIAKISEMINNIFLKFLMLTPAILLSACVTQNYENDSLIVENVASKHEMAATRISLGLGYLNMGNMTQAKLNLEKAKRFAPNLVQVYTAFAHYYETVGENDLTVKAFEKALSITANDADTLNNYGVFLCRQNKIEQAEQKLLKAIAVPSYLLVAQSYENLASCFLQNNDFSKTEHYLSKAIAHSPNRKVTLLQMARLQYAMGHYQQAKIFIKKFERNTTRFSPDSLALAYKIHWKLLERNTAKNYANMLVRMYPKSTQSKQYLLNDLANIEADDLAKRYILTKRLTSSSITTNKVKKRVVKLSPKKVNVEQINKINSDPKVTPIIVAKPIPLASEAITNPNSKMNLKTRSDTLKNTEELESSEKSNSKDVSEQRIKAKNAERKSEKKHTVEPITAKLKKDSVKSALITSASVSELVLTGQGGGTKTVSNNVLAKMKNASKQKFLSVTSPTIPENNKSSATDNAILAVADNSETFTSPVPAKRDSLFAEVVDHVKEKPKEVSSLVKNSNDELNQIKTEKNNSAKTKVELEIKTLRAIKRYKVKRGDTLYAISVKYKVKVNELRKWNNMSITQYLAAGRELYIENPETVNNINE